MGSCAIHGDRPSCSGNPCIIEIGTSDGKIFDRVIIQLTGDGIGPASSGASAFGGIAIKFIFTPLPNGGSPALTPTQAVLAGVFPENSRTSSTSQDASSLAYKLFTASEALRIFSSLEAGNVRLLLGLDFDEEVLNYNLNKVIDVSVRSRACSGAGHIRRSC
jgi:hypothetical protein